MKALSSLLLFLISTCALAQPNFDTVQIRPLKITDNVYMLKGSGGNIGLLKGADGLLMIDDQFAPLSEKISKAVNSIDAGTIRFLINTHLHGDHSGGNENFKKMGVTIVAHDLVRDRMSKETVNARTNQKNPPRDKAAWPEITFAERMNFHLNDEDIELYHFTNGHTDGDVIIKFVKANVFHTGDSFVRTSYPYIDAGSGGSLDGYITNLERILSLVDDKSKIIPGHGELATKADVKGVYDMLVDIRSQVAAAMKKGKKVEDIPALNITAKYDPIWGTGFVKGKDFILIVANAVATKK
jgi:cyclase